MEILDFCVHQLQSQEIDKFELYLEKSSNLGAEVRDGKLDHLSRSTDQGLAIRVLRSGRLGFSYTFDLSRTAVEQAIRTAVEVADLMPTDPYNDLCAVGSARDGFSTVLYPEIENHDTRGLSISLDHKLEIAKALEADAKKKDARIKRVRKAAYNEANWEAVMVDHHGEQIKQHQTVFGAALLCIAEDASGAAEMGYDSQYVNFYDQLKPTEISTNAAHNAVRLLGASAAPTMTCPAIFENSVVAQLIGFLSSSFSAENIDKQFSLLVGKKGEKLFSDKITLIDDALLASAIGSAPFDGEGSPSQTTTLVDQGLIQNFLYDTYYARKHGAKSTASSRRGSLKTSPSIGTSNLYLKKGKKPLEAMISSIKNGIFITDVIGLHTANPVTGEFSVGASGLLIENGVITRPVKGFAIAGNLIELLKEVTEVGSDIRFWGSVGAPSILVAKLSVGGA